MSGMRTLRCAAAVEAASLALLLANLLTVHTEVVASLGGPVHGTAYLIVILAVHRARADPTARWQAWIPGIGGLLALRQLSRNPARGQRVSGRTASPTRPGRSRWRSTPS
ncbi:DUF3817 domain-containing protein [Streptomyces yangpuensis]|uniref:DUF3817 domain-containing protein n=1 Tax=Streptomyces yangpuensis TaxID=1648182 RepID=UPI003719FA1C